jgi:hypothetical protein
MINGASYCGFIEMIYIQGPGDRLLHPAEQNNIDKTILKKK